MTELASLMTSVAFTEWHGDHIGALKLVFHRCVHINVVAYVDWIRSIRWYGLYSLKKITLDFMVHSATE